MAAHELRGHVLYYISYDINSISRWAFLFSVGQQIKTWHELTYYWFDQTLLPNEQRQTEQPPPGAHPALWTVATRSGGPADRFSFKRSISGNAEKALPKEGNGHLSQSGAPQAQPTYVKLKLAGDTLTFQMDLDAVWRSLDNMPRSATFNGHYNTVRGAPFKIGDPWKIPPRVDHWNWIFYGKTKVFR